MKEKFRQALEGFGDIAKEQLRREQLPKKERENISEEDQEELEAALRWQQKQAASKQGTEVETQEEIFDLQKSKQRMMGHLKKKIANLDNPEYKPKRNRKERPVHSEDGKYFWTEDDGSQQELTLGQIMTSHEWNQRLFLDPETVPKRIRKRYIIEAAKHKIGEKADLQIVESKKGADFLPDPVKNAYEMAISKDASEQERPGVLAEKMARVFLKRLTFDHDLPFEIKWADVYQDVSEKIDFIVQRKHQIRGVGVEADDRDKVGVQFTIANGWSRLSHKQKQLRKARKQIKGEAPVEDIVLVSVPMQDITAANIKWKEDKRKNSGGPDQYLSEESLEALYRGILKEILTEDEIEKTWAEISS